MRSTTTLTAPEVSLITTSTLIKRTLRVPLVPVEGEVEEFLAAGEPGPGEAMARRLDSALLTVGYKLSTDLLRHLSTNTPGFVRMTGVRVLAAVQELCGNHVRHNTYFIGFPHDVPDTVEFWVSLLKKSLVPAGADQVPSDDDIRAMLQTGTVNLLPLLQYGTYQHTYEDLLAAHEEFMPAMKDRVTVLQLGDTPIQEMQRLFEIIAGTSTPPSPADRGLLKDLVHTLGGGLNVNFELPGRETKAAINAAILDRPGTIARLVQVDTVTDVLRAVDILSGGDGTLERPKVIPPKPEPVVRSFQDLTARWNGKDAEPVAAPSTTKPGRRGTRFVSLSRSQRRLVMRTLDELLWRDAQKGLAKKAADVYRHQEAWKRLGENVHPHEFKDCPDAQKLFAVARGEVQVATVHGWAERFFAQNEPLKAARVLMQTPGDLARNLDRLLRHPHTTDVAATLTCFEAVAADVSGRVLLSLLEHMVNRLDGTLPRTFFTRTGRLYVTPETRQPISPELLSDVRVPIERELLVRFDESFSGGINSVLDEHGRRVRRPVVFDPAMASVALPLSNKHTPAGLNVLPRGSTVALDQEVLRFFVYWRQRSQRTDFDLSVQYFDADLVPAGHASWTNYKIEGSATYSGDLTDALNGATEFINIRLPELAADVRYIVPQVHIYSGENFGVTGEEGDAVAESEFGFMTLDAEQRGMPFEPRAVHSKLDMRGRGRVAMPLVFERHDGDWRAKWVHLFPRGMVSGGRVEDNLAPSSLLAHAMVRRRYLTVRYLVSLLSTDYEVIEFAGNDLTELRRGPVIYIGMQQPEGLPEGSRVIAPANLTEILPE